MVAGNLEQLVLHGAPILQMLLVTTRPKTGQLLMKQKNEINQRMKFSAQRISVEFESRMRSWREKQQLAYGADDDRSALLRSIACRGNTVREAKEGVVVYRSEALEMR